MQRTARRKGWRQLSVAPVVSTRNQKGTGVFLCPFWSPPAVLANAAKRAQSRFQMTEDSSRSRPLGGSSSIRVHAVHPASKSARESKYLRSDGTEGDWSLPGSASQPDSN